MGQSQHVIDFEAMERPIDRGYAGAECAHAKASTLWKRAAQESLRRVCLTRATFTTDHVREVMREIFDESEANPDPRAMGQVMIAGRKDGWCRPLKNYERSSELVCHGRDKRCWESLLR